MTSAGRHVLVTGAAGFVGRHLVAACQRAGMRVMAVDLRSTPENLTGSALWIRRDCADEWVLREIATGRYTAVLHQAGISDTRAPEGPALRETNVEGPLRIAEACRAGGARLLYASSHSVYGVLRRRQAVAEGAEDDPALCSGPLNPYARSKLALDRAMQDRFTGSDLEWAGLRYTNVFGPDEQDKGPMASILTQLLCQAAAGGPVRVFADTLTAARDYIPVEVVAEVVVRLLEVPVPSRVYNLGAGHAVSFAQLLQWCARWHQEWGPLRVELVPNPVTNAYQYFTCADMAALDAALPGRPAVTAALVHGRAAALFARFRADADAGRLATAVG